MSLRKRLAALLASLILALGLGALATQPASAAGISTKICYSSDSTDHHSLEIWIIGSGAHYNVAYATCGPWLSNTNDQLRVDVCWDNQNISYYQIKSDSGYGPKHYGCNSGSNPPNYNGNVYYKLMN